MKFHQIDNMKNIFKKFISEVLKAESKLVLMKYKPKVVAITGSVGKTSTKDAVYAVLSKFFYVRKSEKSYNSQIGLPLTILGSAALLFQGKPRGSGYSIIEEKQ
jgi:UDP-N-acetylmuramoyl-tripeptide--D-alanyl-D-alanine ligase